MDGLFVVLEPANHMYRVIEAAARRGLRVVAVHTRPLTPPAPFAGALACIAERIPLEGWSDAEAAFERIVAGLGGAPVAGTYAGFEVTLRTEAMLRRRYGLPGHAPDKVDFLLDKSRVRAALRRAGLTTLGSVEEPALRSLREWPFPGRRGFMKPINGSGSAYITRCASLDDVRRGLDEWDRNERHVARFVVEHLRSGRGLFLEEEARGELLSLEGYVVGGEYVPVGITDRAVLARDEAVEMGLTFPSPHPRFSEIVDKVRAIHRCLEVEHGPTHTELIVPAGDGDIELVELNLRFAGADVLVLIDRAFGVAFEDELVTLALGEAPSAPLPAEPAAYASAHYILAPADVRAIESIDIPGDDVYFRKLISGPGTVLKSTDHQSDWIAAFAVSAPHYWEAIARAQKIRGDVVVNGRRLGDDPNNVVRICAEGQVAAQRRANA